MGTPALSSAPRAPRSFIPTVFALALVAGSASAFSTTRNYSTGNSTFGGAASVSAFDSQSTTSYGIYGNAYATGYVLGQSVNLANANGSAVFNYTANRGTVSANLSAFGVTLASYNQGFSTSASVSTPTYTKSSPAIKGVVWLSIVPINLSATATGSIRFSGNVSIQPGNPTTTFSASVGPVTSAGVTATASVSALVASAGVSGSLNLLGNDLKLNGGVSYAIRAINGRRAWTNYSVTSQFNYAAGNIGIWAAYLGRNYYGTLASWNGGSTGVTSLTSGGTTIW